MNIYLSSAYLAPIQYYSKILSDSVYIESNDNYIKQTYRNRCNILSANGSMSLSIPVVHSKGEKCSMRDIRIAEHDNWQHLHWNAIISAYNSTPFFEYYRDDFQPFYEKKYEYLFDFNEELRELICKLIDIDLSKINYTSEYKWNLKPDEIDFRELIHPKKDWRILDRSYMSTPYYQVFSQRFGFVENLSIIDLLFNMGNESLIILNNSIVKV